MLKKPETIIEEAERIVHGPRQESYGHPRDDFAKQAKVWTGLLLDLLKPGVEIPPERIPVLFIGTKLCRHTNLRKRDNRVDIVGYILTDEMLDD